MCADYFLMRRDPRPQKLILTLARVDESVGDGYL